jgi:two-component system, NarL family, sensor histidine kinase DegS
LSESVDRSAVQGAVPAEEPLRDRMARDIERLSEEITEIELLFQQVTSEADRHESRRARTEDRIAALERDPGSSPADLAESRASLITFTRRAMLFEAQQQVLEGKRKVLARFRDRMAEIAVAIDAGAGVPRALRGAASAAAPVDDPTRLEQVRRQEDLRREIVRSLHDGPAQSLANIALQAEIVQRVIPREDARAQAELASLRRMVQHALDTTKGFIFEVRPMVLDDLGLGPTLRRSVADRSRRASIPIDFESRGKERRLSSDLESILFRSVDEIIAGNLAVRPSSLLVRMDWGETELLILIETLWPAPSASAYQAPTAPSSVSVETPPALAAMIAETRQAEHQARSAARTLPHERIVDIAERARVLGVRVASRNDGRMLELVAPIGG